MDESKLFNGIVLIENPIRLNEVLVEKMELI